MRLRLVGGFAWAVVALAASVLLGWATNVDVLKTTGLGSVPMLPITALALLLGAAALRFSLGGATARMTAYVCALGVMSIGLVGLLESALDVQTPLRLLLFAQADGGPMAWPFLMSQAAALCLLLFACATLLGQLNHRLANHGFTGAATLGLLVAMTSLLGHLFGAHELLGGGVLQPIAGSTALALLLLFAGLLLWRPRAGWPQLLLGSSVSATTARRLLPLVIVVPVIGAMYAWTGERLGLYTEQFRLALTTLFSIVLLALVLLRTTLQSSRLEARQRLAAAALRESARRKDDFLAILSHELRNPLAPIRTATEVLRRHPFADPDIENTCAILERQVGHMVRLVDDLLDIARISSGRITVQKRPERIDAVVAHAVEAIRPGAVAAGHVIEVDVERPPPCVDADFARLSQALQNLLTNAVRYTEPGGRIELRVSRKEHEVRVSVRDSGIGIDPRELPRVFEMFTQVGGDGAREGGLGIGLSLTRVLVELHGGRIVAASPGLGQGSEFTIELPIATATAAHEPDTAMPQPSPPPAPRGTTVLLVDDNIDAVELLAMNLEAEGFAVLTATNGPDAIAAARQSRPDALVLDIGLPGMSGYEVARWIREHYDGPAPKLIALTGWGQGSDKRRAAEAGFDHHFTKPVDHRQLLQALRTSRSIEVPVPYGTDEAGRAEPA